MHHFLLRALPLLVSLLGVLPSPTVLAYTFTTIQVQDAVLTEACGINSRGELVGFYADGQAGLFHGFVAGGGNYRLTQHPRCQCHSPLWPQ